MPSKKYRHHYHAKRKKPLIFRRYFWTTTLFLAAFCGGISFACFSPWLQVANIEVAGTQKIDSGDFTKKIQDAAQKQVAFFPTKSILLFNIDAVKEELLKEFPQLADIQIKRQFPSTIYAAVVERSPSAVIKTKKENYYIIDDNGIFFKNLSEDDSSSLFEINYNPPSDLQLGQLAISKDILQKILRVKNNIEVNTDIHLKSAEIINEQRINFNTDEKWQIFINPQKDVDWQIMKLRAVASDPLFQTQRQNLLYIDLRFTKVYAKQRQ